MVPSRETEGKIRVSSAYGQPVTVKLERGDWVKGAAWVTGIATFVIMATAGLLTTIFETRSEALIEHAEIEKKLAVEKARAEERMKLTTRNEAAIENVQKTLIVIDKNQSIILDRFRVPDSQRSQLPAGIGASGP